MIPPSERYGLIRAVRASPVSVKCRSVNKHLTKLFPSTEGSTAAYSVSGASRGQQVRRTLMSTYDRLRGSREWRDGKAPNPLT